MKLILDGDVNVYYIQTLCMIFFPGEKFGAAGQEQPDVPVLSLRLRRRPEGGLEASVTVTANGRSASAVRVLEDTEHHTGCNTALCRRDADLEDGLDLGRAKRERCLLIFGRHR